MATPSFNNNALRFKLKFDFVANKLYLIDSLGSLYNTTYGFILANCKVIAKVVSPDGVIIHQNAGYATNDFSSPDITTPTWTLDLGNIPSDAEGNALVGTYTVDYKMSNGVGTFTTYKAMPYEFTAPVVQINMSANVLTSILTSADVTDYNVNYQGEIVSPSTKTITHKLIKPEGAGYTFGGDNPAQTTAESVRMIGGGGTATSDIWTRVWGAYITSELLYALGSFGTYPLIEVATTITGNEYIDIRYDVFAEDLYDAYKAFIDRWLIACGRQGNNPSAVIASRLQPKVLDLQSEYQKFQLARELGKDTNSHYQKIVTILNSEGFTFNQDDSPKHIAPIMAGTTSSGGSTFSFGIGTEIPTGGQSGDKYIQVTETDKILWSNNSSTWINYGSLKGDTGVAEKTAHVIESDWTAVPIVADSGETLVVEKNVDITGIAVGDRIKVTYGISSDNANPKVSLYHKVNDVALSSKATMDITPNQASDYLMELTITADTDAGASTYPRYEYKNESITGYGSVHTDLIGQTTLNLKLYQSKVDTTVVSNIRVNYIIIETIPYI